MKNFTAFSIALVCTLLSISEHAWAISKDSPSYLANVPTSLTTPDTVLTRRLGQLNFIDGGPTQETINKIYDNLDFIRGVDAFLNGIPAASTYAILEGFKQAGIKPHAIGITEQLLDARTLLLTGNSVTIYSMGELNLENGPVILEIPAGALGAVDDAFFRWIIDLGITGPDRGQGGKYLFVPPGYQGNLPEGYHTVKAKTFHNVMFFRNFVKSGDRQSVVAKIKSSFKMYPLTKIENPPRQQFINISGVQFNTIFANNYSMFQQLNAVVQREPATAFSPELVGQFAAIGIKKGQVFAPDNRMTKILTEASVIANATARTLSFAPRSKSVYFYDDRQWFSPLAGGSSAFNNNGERVLDDRIVYHYMAVGITPAMAIRMVGRGSAYAVAVQDSTKQYLDGSKTYKITLPAPIPMNKFWSLQAYSSQHRSMLETDQALSGLDSLSSKMKVNSDGSYTLWFGPVAPAGQENNWIQTIPGKNWFTILRLYGPLEDWFNKRWKPSDLELVD